MKRASPPNLRLCRPRVQVSESMIDSEYGSYGAPRPLVALFWRSSPPGDAMPGTGALAGDAGVGDAAGQVEREPREIDAVHGRRDAVDARSARVVAELQLVEHRRGEDALQRHDRVLGVRLDVGAAAGHALGLVVRALVAEVAPIDRPVRVQLLIESDVERVFLHRREALELHDVEVGVRRLAGEDHRTRPAKRVVAAASRHRPRARRPRRWAPPRRS